MFKLEPVVGGWKATVSHSGYSYNHTAPTKKEVINELKEQLEALIEKNELEIGMIAECLNRIP